MQFFSNRCWPGTLINALQCKQSQRDEWFCVQEKENSLHTKRETERGNKKRVRFASGNQSILFYPEAFRFSSSHSFPLSEAFKGSDDFSAKEHDSKQQSTCTILITCGQPRSIWSFSINIISITICQLWSVWPEKNRQMSIKVAQKWVH